MQLEGKMSQKKISGEILREIMDIILYSMIYYIVDHVCFLVQSHIHCKHALLFIVYIIYTVGQDAVNQRLDRSRPPVGELLFVPQRLDDSMDEPMT